VGWELPLSALLQRTAAHWIEAGLAELRMRWPHLSSLRSRLFSSTWDLGHNHSSWYFWSALSIFRRRALLHRTSSKYSASITSIQKKEIRPSLSSPCMPDNPCKTSCGSGSEWDLNVCTFWVADGWSKTNLSKSTRARVSRKGANPKEGGWVSTWYSYCVCGGLSC